MKSITMAFSVALITAACGAEFEEGADQASLGLEEGSAEGTRPAAQGQDAERPEADACAQLRQTLHRIDEAGRVNLSDLTERLRSLQQKCHGRTPSRDPVDPVERPDCVAQPRSTLERIEGARGVDVSDYAERLRAAAHLCLRRQAAADDTATTEPTREPARQ